MLLDWLDRVPLGRRYDRQRAPLGLLQRWYAAQPSQRVIVAIIELPQPVDPPALESAVRALCAQQPHALGVCLTRSLTALGTRPLTPSDPVPCHETGDAWEHAEALTQQPFQPGRPLFRVARAAHGKQLVCSFDHIMFDGISASLFASMLVRVLAGAPLPAAELDAHLPLDARLDLRPSAAQLVQALRTPPVPAPPLSSHQRAQRTRIARHVIESTESERLRAHAREAGVSLHAAISACALLAAADVLETRGCLRLHTPISLRARCRPEPRGFGVYIGSTDADLLVGARDVWSIAREYAEKLAEDKPNAPGQLGLLALAGDLRERAKQLENQHCGRTATVEVSNVGRVLDVPEGTNIWLTQGAHYHAPLFVLTLLESAGVVRACLSTPHPLITDAQAARFIEAFSQQLDRA